MWDPLHSNWEQNLLLLRRFREEKCHCLVPEEYEVEGVRLGRWVGRQRQDYKNGRLSENCVKYLTEIEFEWYPINSSWEMKLSLLQRFRKEHGHCLVPKEYEVQGVRLGDWIGTQ